MMNFVRDTMIKLATIVFVGVFLGLCSACQSQHEQAATDLLRLQSWVDKCDSSTVLTGNHKSITKDHFLNSGKSVFKTGEIANGLLVNAGLTSYQSFQDTIGKSNIMLSRSVYRTPKAAAQAFERWVRFQACCIKDDQFRALMSFEDVGKVDKATSMVLLFQNEVLIVEDKSKEGKSKKNGKLAGYVHESLLKDALLGLEISKGNSFRWIRKEE